MTHPDPHFPAVHLRPPCNWVNDPNGLVFYGGDFHVFFQYNPFGPRHANMHWGHARSSDLLNWELLPIALAPSPDGEDCDGVWSGNAVVAENRLHAFYSAKRNDRWWQPIATAVSEDAMVFDKHDDLVVPEPPDGTVMFRDPFVWRDGDRWRMLVGAGLADGRAAALHYHSDDLHSWTYSGPFLARLPQSLEAGGSTERGWECVQRFSFDGCTGLVVSAWNAEEGARGTAVYLGTESGDRLDAEGPEAFDHGPDFYAPALMRAPDGRWLTWGWIWEARDEPRVGGISAWTDEVGWAGMLSLPRELTVTEKGLHQQPAREISELRGPLLFETKVSMLGGTTHHLGNVGAAHDLVAELHRSEVGDAASGVRLLTDAGEYLDLFLDRESGDVIVDRQAASRDARAQGGSWRLPTGVRAGESVQLRAIIDHSVVEVFTASGKALTLRFYPSHGRAWQLFALANGRGSAMVAAKAWNLTGISVEVRPLRR